MLPVRRKQGVPWSKRTRTGRDCSSVQALSHELQDSRHLLPRHVKLPDDLVGLEILEVLDLGSPATSTMAVIQPLLPSP